MGFDRLTEKAIDVLEKAVEVKALDVKTFLKLLSEANGLGKHLLEKVPPLAVKKSSKVDIETLVKEAFFQAIRLEHNYVGTEHLYLALLRLNNFKNIDKAKIEIVRLGVFPSKIDKPYDMAQKTPLLDAFGEDLNHRELRNAAVPLVYRKELERLISTLLLKEKSNALLVGEQGVGKRTLVNLLAQNINSLDVPPALVGYNIRTLNLLSFMTNVANKGGIEFGVASLLDELKSTKRVILVLNNFQDIFYSTPAGLTIPIFYSILKSYFEDAGIPIITFLTPSVYEKLASENEHIIEGFTVVDVEEPPEDVVKEILKMNAKRLEDFHQVSISEEVLKYVYKVAARELKDIKFPQKGLDLLDYACAYMISQRSKIPESYKNLVDRSFELAGSLEEKMGGGDYDSAFKVRKKIEQVDQNLDKKEKEIFSTAKKLVLTTKDVDHVLSHLELGGPESKEIKNISKFKKIADALKKEIIGQDEAVDVVSRALIRAKLGLRSKKHPLGNFLFLGPTGVGKTELAKVLAKVGFSENGWSGIIRLDMSDFSEKHTVARLIGAPPGYVGYGEGGELTSKIESHPDSVVLFDEIEKAHPDVLNILLQIMEEGELADAKGNTFDFSKSVVILTSNLGTEILHNTGIGFEERDLPDSKIEGRLKENLKKILKPELLNRFDEVIVFKRLSKSELMKIVNLLLEDVKTSLIMQVVLLKTSLQVKKELIEKGYSKEYGARALRRTIEKEILDRIAQILLVREDRPLKIKAEMKNGAIVIDLDSSLARKSRKRATKK